MTFDLDGAALIDIVPHIAVLGFMWRLSRGMAPMERRFNERVDDLRRENKQDFAKLETKIEVCPAECLIWPSVLRALKGDWKDLDYSMRLYPSKRRFPVREDRLLGRRALLLRD